MRVCIIGKSKSNVSLEIKIALEERGYVCKRLQVVDIYFSSIVNQFKALHRRVDLDQFDIFIFRNIAHGDREYVFTLANYLASLNKIVFDGFLKKYIENNINILFLLSQHNIPTVQSIFTLGRKTARDILIDLPHPILIKQDNSDTKNYIMSDEWTDSYDAVRTNTYKKFEFQEYVNTRTLYRVHMIGEHVIGGLKRQILDKDNKLSFSNKFKSTFFRVEDHLADLSKKVSQALDFAFFHIDFVEINGQFYVFNVKRSTDFRLFSKLSGINYCQKLVEFLEKTYQNRYQ
jgi:glutathione synthase/RimK-type ligase-like ATP-grasp enzyme